ncbi:MAG: zinc ribbon domain-containing protein [Lautropia sp.]|nr:zinc ribbon domain-containing protein [Lautropia sp.]
MPIYAYQCSSCGYHQDVLQKMSDAPLTVCPSCERPDFNKQLSAPAFQLKGSGWYVTDFRDNGKKPPAREASSAEAGEGKASSATTSGGSDKSDKAAKPAAAGTGSAGD